MRHLLAKLEAQHWCNWTNLFDLISICSWFISIPTVGKNNEDTTSYLRQVEQDHKEFIHLGLPVPA